MTKKDAIKFANCLKNNYTIDFNDMADFCDMVIQALEQPTSDDDVMAIHTQGLDEGIRCAMCTNTMKSDRGCDGGCVVDEDMYKKVMDTIKNHIFNQPTSEDCIARQPLIDNWNSCADMLMGEGDSEIVMSWIFDAPPVTPTLPKGATNGDVIKILFPNIEADEIKTNTGGYIEVKYLDTTDKCDATAFRKNWWNALISEVIKMVGIKGLKMPSCCRECEYTPKDCSYCLRLHQAIPRIPKNIFNTSRLPNCPLVEIEEYKVGKWILIDEESNTWQCTHCKELGKDDWWQLNSGTPQDNKMDYCPHCGAEMRGMKND